MDKKAGKPLRTLEIFIIMLWIVWIPVSYVESIYGIGSYKCAPFVCYISQNFLELMLFTGGYVVGKLVNRNRKQ
jgi:hypothetical protein